MRDLESDEEDLRVDRISGGESIVAAGLGTPFRVVTIWSNKEEMGRLHSFDVRNHKGQPVFCIVDTGSCSLSFDETAFDDAHCIGQHKKRLRGFNKINKFIKITQ